MFFLRFACLPVLFFFIPAFLFVLLFRWRWYQAPRYVYSLGDAVVREGIAIRGFPKKVLSFLRGFALCTLLFLIPRPQLVDQRSKVTVEGVAIVLALDVSGSMRFIDSLDEQRMRIDVAKQEAIRFVGKRTNDPIGVVIFGKDILSRIPLTLDKTMLVHAIETLRLGIIDSDGTALGSGLATAINRVRDAKAKSKVVILLTDGVPVNDAIAPQIAIELAKKFEVKVYTIGIGREGGGYVADQFGFAHQVPESMDMSLLQRIAQETGGRAFRAHDQKELQKIYDEIDQLEKTPHETEIYQRYYELYGTIILLVLVLLAFELFLKAFVWRGLT